MSSATPVPAGLIAGTTLLDYFRETVSRAVARQRVQVGEDTVCYVVHLLERFSRAERLFEPAMAGDGLQPLALHYARALEAVRAEERQQALRRLGDVALLISGLFADSLHRKVVDLDYYIAMGSQAYGVLSDTARSAAGSRVLQGVFTELSAQFQAFVDVLAEVGEDRGRASPQDMLRLYEVWVRTGSRRAADQLRQRGIEPLGGSVSRRQN